MFKLVRSFVVLLNLYVLVQAQPEGRDVQPKQPKLQEALPQVPNMGHVSPEQLVQAYSSNPTDTDLNMNSEAFQGLADRFGNLGPLLFGVVTDPDALGREFTKLSKVVSLYIPLTQYRESLDNIFRLTDAMNIAQRLEPLFSRISDIRDRETGRTMGEAIEIITNILRDPEAVKEIRDRIQSPKLSTESVQV